MGKRKKSTPLAAPEYDEDEWSAKQQVERAFMETPLAKSEVRRVKKEIKTARKRVERDVRQKVTSKTRAACQKPSGKRDR